MKAVLLTIGFFISSIAAFSQVKQGELLYDVFVSSDNPQTAAWMEQNLQNSTAELYFTNEQARSNLYLGSFMTQSSISTSKSDTILLLMDGMMGKIAMKIDKNDTTSEMGDAYIPVHVELLKETKEIIGYTCYKAVVTMKKGNKVTVWYTKDINPSYRGGRFLIEGIPGVPLEFHSDWGGRGKLKMVAYKFKTKIKDPASIFTLTVPDGFKLMTSEELKAMRGGRR